LNVGPTEDSVLTINGGSSSIKFALYQIGSPMQRSLTGIVDRIGLSRTTLTYSDTSRDQQESRRIGIADHTSAA
jgi:acetate kinase